ncbi:MAG: hypothetical protein WD011_06990 [Nitriliruptoraceae bacterium]
MRDARVVVTLLGGAAGVVLLVIGIVALARTGIPADTLTAPTAGVGPFTRTPLMAIIEILLGVLLLSAAASRDVDSLTGIGLVMLVFGIVWLIEPGAFTRLLGVGRETAAFYLVVGALGLATGLGRSLVASRGSAER